MQCRVADWRSPECRIRATMRHRHLVVGTQARHTCSHSHWKEIDDTQAGDSIAQSQRINRMDLKKWVLGVGLLSAATMLASNVLAQRFITVASTTSTEQSGLFKHIVP